ncbi:MAG: response regulator [Bdellovibrionia bacterium]
MTISTVALVEDDSDIRNLTAAMLEDSGYNVITFEDGASALRKLSAEEKTVCALLTDFKMPCLDGVSLIRELHERQIKIPIIVLISGDIDGSHRLESLSNEIAIKVLRKPYSKEALLSLLHRVK